MPWPISFLLKLQFTTGKYRCTPIQSLEAQIDLQTNFRQVLLISATQHFRTPYPRTVYVPLVSSISFFLCAATLQKNQNGDGMGKVLFTMPNYIKNIQPLLAQLDKCKKNTAHKFPPSNLRFARRVRNHELCHESSRIVASTLHLTIVQKNKICRFYKKFLCNFSRDFEKSILFVLLVNILTLILNFQFTFLSRYIACT